jgi:hypothetical protein
MKKYNLPIIYDSLKWYEKKNVREQYIQEQKGKCMYCGCDINEDPPKLITEKYINWDFFPPNFLSNPIHLQHDHNTGLTEGAVHAYCNAVMWQYEGR